MRDRFLRSMERIVANQERLGELFWPFDRTLDRKAPRVRKPGADAPVLTEITDFGSNPGALTMFAHVPANLKPDAPLVVVLHGCRQTAASYDRASGWAALAEEEGFAVLYPEQRLANNQGLCFNWFRPSEVTRDRGELMSIRQMIESLAEHAKSDRRRIFITGLSAGGAMTAAMLANYPELFAGGTIIAGLPFGAARDATRALQAMEEAPERSAREWGDLVRKVSPQIVSKPVISVWHGTADETVSASNADAILAQWLDVYGLDISQFTETASRARRVRRWRDAEARSLVEFHEVAGLGHGTPVARGFGGGYATCGEPFMLDVGFSSTLEIARDWGLLPLRRRLARTAAHRG
ncbi:PHB depolymerase family esterase [Sinorhizobium sp. BG8]|uniref:extracellular catalytic domain type 1 short-chain-length polyhydroxyalkanoate depolymerase n=1 Tax=Sinorhizobium sp. BG8 TaxID=2613773 RepID=UPI00193D6799|nr:PHB depolymerase family esterase [Sinorhizobium sp. BG8]QRM54803.1 PHB depolymerase family esterase [Sinorhizobium sp. BG8]